MTTASRTVAIASSYQSNNELVHSYLQHLENSFHVAWLATSGQEIIRYCAESPPAVLVLSPGFRDAPFLDIVRVIREEYSDVRVLIFTRDIFGSLIDHLRVLGVHGVVDASNPLLSLVSGIMALMKGQFFFEGSRIHSGSHPVRSKLPLTQREYSVLRYIAEGFSTKEVANELQISLKGAEKSRQRIMAKLNLHDVVKLTRYAIGNGISTLEYTDKRGLNISPREGGDLPH